jgi:hypothetical protein
MPLITLLKGPKTLENKKMFISFIITFIIINAVQLLVFMFFIFQKKIKKKSKK